MSRRASYPQSPPRRSHFRPPRKQRSLSPRCWTRRPPPSRHARRARTHEHCRRYLVPAVEEGRGTARLRRGRQLSQHPLRGEPGEAGGRGPAQTSSHHAPRQRHHAGHPARPAAAVRPGRTERPEEGAGRGQAVPDPRGGGRYRRRLPPALPRLRARRLRGGAAQARLSSCPGDAGLAVLWPPLFLIGRLNLLHVVIQVSLCLRLVTKTLGLVKTSLSIPHAIRIWPFTGVVVREG